MLRRVQLWAVTRHELAKHATFDDAYLSFVLKTPPAGSKVPVGAYYLTKQGLDGHRYRLGHPLTNEPPPASAFCVPAHNAARKRVSSMEP